MWLRVWDKTKEKNGKNTAIYQLHTRVKQNLRMMPFLKEIVEHLLEEIEPHRFMVLLQEDEEISPEIKH